MTFLAVQTREELFWAKVDKQANKACWPWRGGNDGKGYGLFWNGYRSVRAHRFAYEVLIGPITEGMTLDHLCRNRACVNPDHLEAIDIHTNILRGNGPSAQNARKTHCPKGHPYDLINTSFFNGGRYCRSCHPTYYKSTGQSNKLKMSCPRGHAYDVANTIVHRGRRECRSCERERSRQRRLMKSYSKLSGFILG